MSAVYDEVKRKAIRQQVRGFATMGGEPAEPVAATLPENSSSTVGQYVGSAFLPGTVIMYAVPGEADEMGVRAKMPVQPFPLLGQIHTSTMAAGGAWVASEPEVYNSGVVRLPWARKVIYSGKIHVKTSELRRRPLRAIVDDSPTDEGNG